MKSSFLRTTTVALTMWFGLFAGAANATVLTFNGWTLLSSGEYTSSFSSDVTSTPFSDTLDFSLPGTGPVINGLANSISLNASGSLVFTSLQLWDMTAATQIDTGATFGVFMGQSVAGLSFTSSVLPGSYQLRIGGTGVGGYGGSLNVTPVPEPETYAMLLAGLGLMGFTARRRKNNA